MSRRHLAGLGAAALLVRLVFLWLADPHVPLISDGHTYHLVANNLADGHGWVAPYDFLNGVERPTAEFPPVHELWLAAWSLVGASSITWHQLAMAVLGSLTPVLTAVLGWQLTGRRAVALGAGALASVHPLLLGSEGALMSETTFTVCALAATTTLLRTRAASKTTRFRPRYAVGAGVLLGLAALTRGEGLLLIPFVAVPLLWREWRRLGLVVVTVGVVLVPWVARNAVAFDGRLIVSNNIGGLVNGANCPPSYEGPGLGSWSFECYGRVELPGTDEAENGDALRRAGIDHARDNAGRLPVVAAARIGRTWSLFRPFEQARLETEFEGRRFGPQATGIAVDWFLLPFAVAGTVLLRRARRPIAPIVGLVVMVTAVSALTYGNVRFRQVAEPALLVGALNALVNVARSK